MSGKRAPTVAETVLRAASEQATKDRGGGPADALEHLQQVCFVLASWCAGLARSQSQGYVRAGLEPVGDPVEQRPTNPTLLEGEH